MDTPIHISWSKNSKTGDMPVSTTGSETCSPSCPHNKHKTCYAKYSFLGLHWRHVDSGKRDMGWGSFLNFVSALKDGQLWRHNQAGDLMGLGVKVDRVKLNELVNANKGKRGFTYTHKQLTPTNLEYFDYANRQGFTINYSCDSVRDALTLKENVQFLGKKLPIVVTVPEDYEPNHPDVKICPEQISGVQCVKCQWCAMSDRTWIIAFRGHGIKKGMIK